MSEPLSVAEVRGMLLEIVAGFPDGHCYEKVTWRDETAACVYSVDGVPSCLIGHLFHRLGVVIPEWQQGMPVSYVVPVYARFVFTGAALEYMSNVQKAQDSCMPWAAALRFADDVLREQNTTRSADVAPEATL